MPLPILREELELLPGPVLPDGQPSWTLHDPVRNLFFRIDWPSFEILTRWSLGDPAAIVEAVSHNTTLSLKAGDVEQLARFLVDNQLVQQTGPDAPAQLAERFKKIKGTPASWLLHRYLFFRVPLWRPDAWLERMRPLADIFYSRGFIALTLIALLIGAGMVFRQWDTYLASLVDTFNFSGLLAYAVAIFFVKWLHELGHAFTAKRYGCRIPAMGVAFLVMWPMAYTDTNETWRLTDNTQRLKVAIAGIVTELVIAVWATLAWTLLPDGGLRGAAFVLATTSWVATLAINASPFLRFDGYFILCDLLDMPNLHGRSFALARWKLREWLFALGEAKPEHFSPRKERALIVFAWATWIYRLVVFLGIALLVYHFFFKALGVFLAAVELVWFIGLPIWRELKAWGERSATIRQQPASRRRFLRTSVLALLLLGVLAVPLPGRISASALLRPVDAWPVFLPESAQLLSLPQKEGRLAAGAQVAVLDAPALRSQAEVLRARQAQLRWQAAVAGLSSQTRDRMLVSQEELATAAAELASIEKELARLEPLAPFEAQLRDVDPDLRPGQWLPAGERLAVLIGSDRMLVESFLDEESLRRVRVGDGGIFITDSLAGPVLRLRVVQIHGDATRALPSGLLSAPAGGHLLTRVSEGQHVPEGAVYRVVLEVLSAPEDLAGYSWRGRLVIRGEAQPLAARYLRQIAAVLVREFGV